MSGYEVKHCRSCSAPIIWSVTHQGRRMPVDAEPRPDGNVTLRHQGGDGDLPPVAEYPGKEHGMLFTEDHSRYVSHFVTCGQSDEWRRS